MQGWSGPFSRQSTQYSLSRRFKYKALSTFESRVLSHTTARLACRISVCVPSIFFILCRFAHIDIDAQPDPFFKHSSAWSLSRRWVSYHMSSILLRDQRKGFGIQSLRQSIGVKVHAPRPKSHQICYLLSVLRGLLCHSLLGRDRQYSHQSSVHWARNQGHSKLSEVWPW